MTSVPARPSEDAVATRSMVIAIDGPAGAGKSTVTRQVAARLGILYLDTGAMYRAATVALFDAGVDLDDADAVATEACQHSYDFDAAGAVRVDGSVVAERIRTPEVTSQIYRVADNPACRAHLVAAQQQILAGRDAALEGRDATTVICPDAPLKIYLDASPEERARRRLAEWEARGELPAGADLASVAADIRQRDERDMNRAVGALQQADDAVPVVTDGLSPETVISRIIALAVQRRPLLLEQLVADQLLVGRSRAPGYVRVAEGSISEPAAPWQLGLTNPSDDRLPTTTRELARNTGGRQAGVLCQGRAVLVLAGAGDQPGAVLALPMLPQSWYVIEPDCWHAVVQEPGTICAWAESATISEDRAALSSDGQEQLAGFLAVYLPGE